MGTLLLGSISQGGVGPSRRISRISSVSPRTSDVASTSSGTAPGTCSTTPAASGTATGAFRTGEPGRVDHGSGTVPDIGVQVDATAQEAQGVWCQEASCRRIEIAVAQIDQPTLGIDLFTRVGEGQLRSSLGAGGTEGVIRLRPDHAAAAVREQSSAAQSITRWASTTAAATCCTFVPVFWPLTVHFFVGGYRSRRYPI